MISNTQCAQLGWERYGACGGADMKWEGKRVVFRLGTSEVKQPELHTLCFGNDAFDDLDFGLKWDLQSSILSLDYGEAMNVKKNPQVVTAVQCVLPWHWQRFINRKKKKVSLRNINYELIILRGQQQQEQLSRK